MSRDSQRSRAYRAEEAVRDALDRGYGGPMSWDATRVYIDRVFRTRWFRRKWPEAHVRYMLNRITLADGRGTRIARGGLYRISLPVWARTPSVILHEIAHGLAPNNAHHDHRWAAIFLELVRHYIGREAHDALKRSFKEHKVRFRPKRQLSPETRAMLAERMRQYRLAARPPQDA